TPSLPAASATSTCSPPSPSPPARRRHSASSPRPCSRAGDAAAGELRRPFGGEQRAFVALSLVSLLLFLRSFPFRFLAPPRPSDFARPHDRRGLCFRPSPPLSLPIGTSH